MTARATPGDGRKREVAFSPVLAALPLSMMARR
jgi:hypothetical protein